MKQPCTIVNVQCDQVGTFLNVPGDKIFLQNYQKTVDILEILRKTF